MLTSTALALSLLAGGAFAQDGTTDDPPAAATDLPTASAAGVSGNIYRRTNLMELNLRGRYVTLPDSILDIWYVNSDEEGANPLPRPKARGYIVGLEYVIKPRPHEAKVYPNWTFYAEYMGHAMDEGYWDDREDNDTHDDGDWIRPDGFGLMIAGANAAAEFELQPWVSFLVGGGLGVAVVKGELTQWSPGGNADNDDPECLTTSAAYERVDVCGDDGPKPVPGVLPMVDLTAGFRFNLGDQANIRVEGGLHDLLYMGVAGGIVF